MTKDQFPIRLHEARMMMGLSMDKLVERTGGAITKQSISRYEKGIMRPKRPALLALANALRISEKYLPMVKFQKKNCWHWKPNFLFGQSNI